MTLEGSQECLKSLLGGNRFKFNMAWNDEGFASNKWRDCESNDVFGCRQKIALESELESSAAIITKQHALGIGDSFRLISQVEISIYRKRFRMTALLAARLDRLLVPDTGYQHGT